MVTAAKLAGASAAVRKSPCTTGTPLAAARSAAQAEECARCDPALDERQAAVEVPPHDRLLLRVAPVARHHRIEAAREVALPVERIEHGGLHDAGHEDHPARAAHDRIAGLDEG